jgi:hypothetical protein
LLSRGRRRMQTASPCTCWCPLSTGLGRPCGEPLGGQGRGGRVSCGGRALQQKPVRTVPAAHGQCQDCAMCNSTHSMDLHRFVIVHIGVYMGCTHGLKFVSAVYFHILDCVNYISFDIVTFVFVFVCVVDMGPCGPHVRPICVPWTP